ncbi:MAG TPA: hypothetical protein VI384_04330 [Candidatus Dormibacteraeota bacterium]
MTDSDKVKFSEAMTALGVAFGAAVNPGVLQAYWQFLRDLELVAFLRAVDAAGKTLKWFPKPAELRDLAGAGTALAAAQAWEAVRGAMDKHDYTATVDFGVHVNAVVRNLWGTWPAACARSLRDLTFDRARFETLYAEMAGKPNLRGAPLRGTLDNCEVVRVAIGGVTAPAALPEKPSQVSAVVRKLADRADARLSSEGIVEAEIEAEIERQKSNTGG